jgi:trimeric autotransporter adhesin
MSYKIKGVLSVTKRIDQVGSNGNTFIGLNAGDANTSGTGNVAIGDLALTLNTAGNNNTVVGDNAMLNNTATDGTAIGRNALALNTSGIRNTAVGSGAMAANTISSQSTCVGWNAMGNSTGALNTAVGIQALLNVTGSDNTAVGEDALRDTTTGTRNCAFGGFTLAQATTGNDNVALGRQSMNTFVTGSANVCVGNGTGGEITSGSFNTAIGHTAHFGGAGAATGRIAIGCSAAGNPASSVFDDALFFHNALAATAGTTVVYSGGGQMGPQVSSRRFKENIANIEVDTSKVLDLRPVSFDYKPAYMKDVGRQFGLIAEEVEELFPSIVPKDFEGKAIGVNYDRIAVLLIAEVRKLRDQVVGLQSQVDKLTIH